MAERIGRQSPTQSFVLPYRDTAGPEAVEIYEKSGREPYDWQKLLDYDILARNKNGEWLHMKYGFAVPRQNGCVLSIRNPQHIISLFPDTMKKSERKKAIKAKIREEFKSEKGYPSWAQSSDWPLGKDGKPATYLGKGKNKGDLRRWQFRDESTGEILVVEQYY